MKLCVVGPYKRSRVRVVGYACEGMPYYRAEKLLARARESGIISQFDGNAEGSGFLWWNGWPGPRMRMRELNAAIRALPGAKMVRR